MPTVACLDDIQGPTERIQVSPLAVSKDGQHDVIGDALVRAALQRSDERCLVNRLFQAARLLVLFGTRKRNSPHGAGWCRAMISGRPHGGRYA
ncbi:MAG: hypothetical protein Q4D91_12995 [Lautropia sp.]|nr:hypothetical protein [Lautropia sp.]